MGDAVRRYRGSVLVRDVCGGGVPMSERSPDYLSGYQAGFVDGYFTDSEQLAPLVSILTGLIAELRELATCDIDLGNQTDPETIAFLLDRAEARLKGLNDE